MSSDAQQCTFLRIHVCFLVYFSQDTNPRAVSSFTISCVNFSSFWRFWTILTEGDKPRGHWQENRGRLSGQSLHSELSHAVGNRLWEKRPLNNSLTKTFFCSWGLDMVFPLWIVLPAERLQLFSCGKTRTLAHCLSVLLWVQKQVVLLFQKECQPWRRWCFSAVTVCTALPDKSAQFWFLTCWYFSCNS